MASDTPSEHRNINDRVVDEARPVLEWLHSRLDLTDEEWDLVNAALARVAFRSVRVGVAEALAQAIEQGADIAVVLKLPEHPLPGEDLDE